MLSKLKGLLKDTTVYGASTILASGLNYILVPFYANVLSLEENGIQTLVYSSITFFAVVFPLGLESAFMKFSTDQKKTLSGEAVSDPFFTTAFWGVIVAALLFSTMLFSLSKVFSRLIGMMEEYHVFIRYAAVILLLDSVASIPLAWLRRERKAKRFSLIRLINVGTTILATLCFVVVLKWGVHGVFIGNCIGSLVGFVLGVREVVPKRDLLPKGFSLSQWGELLKYGLPLVPNSIAMMVISFVDRLVLIRLPESSIAEIYGKAMTSEELLGIYGRVYSLAVLAQLVVRMFRFAWQPFYLQESNEKNAKELFRWVFSLITIGMIGLVLSASMFVPLLIEVKWFNRFYILPPSFWIGLSVLPILYLAYVFDAMSSVLVAGLLIEKKTGYLPLVTFVGAGVTIVLALLLIPRVDGWGAMTGAALAHTIGSLTMMIGSYFFSQRVYPNTFDWGRLGLSFGIGGLVYYGFVELKTQVNPWVIASVAVLIFGVVTGVIFRREVEKMVLRVKKR